MKKVILVLMIVFLLIGINLYAADGDLIVEGKIGVGTTTPSEALDVNGNILIRGNSLIGNNISGGNLTFQSTSDAAKGKILFGNSAYDEVNNRLGINVTSPVYTLDVLTQRNDNSVGINSPPSVQIIAEQAGTRGIIGQDNIARFTGTQSNDLAYFGLRNTAELRSTQTGSITFGNAVPFAGSVNTIKFNSTGGGTYTINGAPAVLSANFFNPDQNAAIFNIANGVMINSGGLIGGSGGNNAQVNITNLKHFAVNDYQRGDYNENTVQNQYGFYINNLVNGVASNVNVNIGTGPASGNWSIYNNSPYNNYFAGNVGIGTTTPTAKLDVNGSTGYNQLRLRTAYTPTGTSDANGNVGDITRDDNYVYVKTSAGWKRASLTTW